MKKSLMAVALVGAFAGVAHAQTAVQIYGNVDLGAVKQSDKTMAIGKRAPNTLGFKGTEELGNGLKALFQLEMRYDTDTGTQENNVRPLFQGQSRVGLQGDFGTVRIGRGTTAYQDTIGAFEPWRGIATPSGFYSDLAIGGYSSQPLEPAGSSANRWSNAFWYNSPVVNGLQLNTTIATKEANAGNGAVLPRYPAGSEASVNPFSVTATYNDGAAAIMLGYERNAVESTVWSIGSSLFLTPALKLSILSTHQDQGHTAAIGTAIPGAKTNAWVLGANYFMGAGKILAGYGQKTADNYAKTTQLSLGYEYSLSKRTYLYVDASRKNGAQTQFGVVKNVKYYDLGINHSF